MSNSKLTDSEIVNCKNCIHKIICIFHNDSGTSAKKCVDFIDKDLINRLQAENERLKNSLAISKNETKRYKEVYKIACTERNEFLEQIETAEIKAYKECIEKVKEELKNIAKIEWQDNYYYLVGTAFFDNLLKEMVGDKDA